MVMRFVQSSLMFSKVRHMNCSSQDPGRLLRLPCVTHPNDSPVGCETTVIRKLSMRSEFKQVSTGRRVLIDAWTPFGTLRGASSFSPSHPVGGRGIRPRFSWANFFIHGLYWCWCSLNDLMEPRPCQVCIVDDWSSAHRSSRVSFTIIAARLRCCRHDLKKSFFAFCE